MTGFDMEKCDMTSVQLWKWPAFLVATPVHAVNECGR